MIAAAATAAAAAVVEAEKRERSMRPSVSLPSAGSHNRSCDCQNRRARYTVKRIRYTRDSEVQLGRNAAPAECVANDFAK